MTTAHARPDTAALSNTSLHLLLCQCHGFWRAKHQADSLKSSLGTSKLFWYNLSGSRRDDKYLNTSCDQTQRGGSKSKCSSRNHRFTKMSLPFINCQDSLLLFIFLFLAVLAHHKNEKILHFHAPLSSRVYNHTVGLT